jgi:hypothetical protein
MDEDLTNIGPEPPAPKPRGPRRRLNVEAILLMAKYDEEFQKKLFTNRQAALEETGLNLSQGEKLLLSSISDEQLSQNIREFRVPGVNRKSLSNWARAAAVLLQLSSLALTETGCLYTGSTADERAAAKKGIPSDSLPPSEGITPDKSDSTIVIPKTEGTAPPDRQSR